MRVCKLVCAVVARHVWLMAIYIGVLALFGVIMARSVMPAESEAYTAAQPAVAVIDRDGSAVSRALARCVLANAEPIELADEPRAIQEAAAKDLASYILIIPEGYGDDLISSARAQAHGVGADLPALQTIVSYQDMTGSLMDVRTRGIVSQIAALAAVSDAPADDLAQMAEDAAGSRASVDVEAANESGMPLSYLVYCQFATYALFGGCAIIIAQGLSSLSRARRAGEGSIRARIAASGVPATFFSLQTGLACLVVGAFTWVASGAVGLIVCAQQLAQIPVESIVLMQVPLFALMLVGVAFGFLLWQVGASTEATHAAGNIGSMLATALGGTWVSQDLMGPMVLAVAHLTPVYWAVRGMSVVYAHPGLGSAVIGEVLTCSGIVALFALALAAVGLAVGRAQLVERGA